MVLFAPGSSDDRVWSGDFWTSHRNQFRRPVRRRRCTQGSWDFGLQPCMCSGTYANWFTYIYRWICAQTSSTRLFSKNVTPWKALSHLYSSFFDRTFHQRFQILCSLYLEYVSSDFVSSWVAVISICFSEKSWDGFRLGNRFPPSFFLSSSLSFPVILGFFPILIIHFYKNIGIFWQLKQHFFMQIHEFLLRSCTDVRIVAW